MPELRRPLDPARRLTPFLLGGTLAAALAIGPLAGALASTSHAGWPPIQHLYQNKTDANATAHGVANLHNELLGGNGSDTLYAGRAGDVLWGDSKPGAQPTTQVDTMVGGPGNDIFYASHGVNVIDTGTGKDIVHAHYGRGTIRCRSAADIVYLSHKSRPDYKLSGCRQISYATAGA